MKVDILDDVSCADPESLPDPTQQIRFIAPAVVEIIAGVRGVEQLGAVLSEEVYLRLRERAMLAARVRRLKDERDSRPAMLIRNLRMSSPRPGVVESVVLLSSQSRTRAVAIRLEGRYNRWLATSVSII
ncbi:MAG: hypothetical protein RLZZ626_245 [Actinomycetota bacterium]|jgi:hypothetical protein